MSAGRIHKTNDLPVAIVGAGPIGMAATAHLVLRGVTPVVLGDGVAVGHAVAEWQHVRTFSPWTYNVDNASRTLLAAAPSRDRIYRDACVMGISRYGHDRPRSGPRASAPYILHVAAQTGRPQVIKAAAVTDCSGTWARPNPAGAHGLPALGEPSCANRISYGMPDVSGRDRYQYSGGTILSWSLKPGIRP
jgi:threonine dehydrogenase-like Zn-dependent dehydrogenase